MIDSEIQDGLAPRVARESRICGASAVACCEMLMLLIQLLLLLVGNNDDGDSAAAAVSSKAATFSPHNKLHHPSHGADTALNLYGSGTMQIFFRLS